MFTKAACQWASSLTHQQLWRGGSMVNGINRQSARSLNVSSCLGVGVTLPLRAEPPRKAVKADPGLEKSRKERQLKRLQKVQHRMGAPDLKPVEEFMYDSRIFTEDRKRPAPNLTFEEEERRALLQKEWTFYKQTEYAEETRMIAIAKRSQQRALEELRAESEDLYQQALEKDFWLFPLEIKGPTRTPPMKEYRERLSLDGEYVDKTKQFK